MSEQNSEIAQLYRQLGHVMKELQVIQRELARIVPERAEEADPTPDNELSWEALHRMTDVWEREWDTEWKEIWESA